MDYRIKDALQIYDSVFLSYSRAFTNDLYNAALCAVFERDVHKLIAYTKRIINQSDEDIFTAYENIPDFRRIKKDKRWKDFFDKNQSVFKRFPSKQDSIIGVYIDEITKREQDRKKENGEKLSEREIDEIFLRSCKDLLLLFETEGVSWMSYYYTKYQYKIQAMLLHYYSMLQKCVGGVYSDFPLEEILKFDSLLVSSVHQGYKRKNRQ